MTLSTHAAHLKARACQYEDFGRPAGDGCRDRSAAHSVKIPRIDVDTASREKLIAHIDELEFLVGDLMPKDVEAAEWDCISLDELGAPHGRPRVRCARDHRPHAGSPARLLRGRDGDVYL